MKIVVPDGGAPTEALVANPTRFGPITVREVIAGIRAGLDEDEFAVLLGIDPADIHAAMVFHGDHAAALDALPAPDTLFTRIAQYHAALQFYSEDSFYDVPRSDDAVSFIAGDHGYAARKALGRPNAFDLAHDAAQAAELKKLYAEVVKDSEAGTLQMHDWSKIDALFDHTRREVERRTAFEATVLADLMRALLEHHTVEETARVLFTRNAALNGRPIDLLGQVPVAQLRQACGLVHKEPER